MTKKVRVAVFDKDLKCRLFKLRPLTKDGGKIMIADRHKGGRGIVNPTFDNKSYLELPYRSLIPPFPIKWQRIYFARNGAKACVNFETGTVPGPDQEDVMRAAGTEMLNNIGKEKVETPVLMYIVLALLIIITLKVLGVLV